jgi:N-methylhydantoinase A
MSVHIGIDVGGTFTDAVIVTANGDITVSKALTTPNQANGAVNSVAQVLNDFSLIETIVHGTTVATNAILERRGATVGLITTEGFRDILEFQRQERRNIWDLFSRKIPPLVPRQLRLEVKERIAADGSVRTVVDEVDARAVIAQLKDARVEAIAVCLLNSYANAAHEEALQKILRDELPGAYTAVSSRIAPHFREYDRMSTTVLSAYVGPKIKSYLADFRSGFKKRAFRGTLLVMGSNGGVLPPEVSIEHAATTCLSGPAGGVLATLRIADDLSIKNAISFDMGGTSTDVSLISRGTVITSARSEIGGLPISLPQIRIETVSAGGGSIASLDSGGLLHVGPQSAGSQPGPACYGLGGERPTVTDAVLLMGLLRSAQFFGGKMLLDHEAAAAAFARLAKSLDTTIVDVAEKIFTIANSKMGNAVRVVSIREGHDPRDFVLFAFGGAGPLHACAMADELGIPRVVIPMYPGAFSAFGLLCAHLRRDFVRTLVKPVNTITADDLKNAFRELTAHSLTSAQELGEGNPAWHYSADLRYRGQAYEVNVDVRLQRLSIEKILTAFHRLHRRQFGFSDQAADVEIVNIRALAQLRRQKPVLPSLSAKHRAHAVEMDSGQIFVLGNWRSAHFVSREHLRPGDEKAGPMILEEATATTYIPPGWTFRVHEAGHIDAKRD